MQYSAAGDLQAASSAPYITDKYLNTFCTEDIKYSSLFPAVTVVGIITNKCEEGTI